MSHEAYNLPNGSIGADARWAPLGRHFAHETQRYLLQDKTGLLHTPSTFDRCVVNIILDTLNETGNNTIGKLIAGLRLSVNDGQHADFGDYENRDSNIRELADSYLGCRGEPISLAELKHGLSDFQEAAATKAAQMIFAYHVGIIVHDLLEVCRLYSLNPSDTYVSRSIPEGRYAVTTIGLENITSVLKEMVLRRTTFILLDDYTLYLY
jgi:hypothetical protein